ncbi:cysteine dioxygenase family protein [Pseudazoarcus pumilus]|uniref:Cysteine dioxygenase n=1 Tax=Pseudazoarcus pumilus TaxID=2067960 RepID=A0A2I6SA45_9RHOO|nr:cysteine dioxygenase [Pseudazoarcus pumilus]AUN96138.1 cysteine dioxygenase [Pseudazoarcus pumilus]
MSNFSSIRHLIRGMTDAVAGDTHDEPRLMERARPLLADLISSDDWLPDEFAQPHPEHYQQYLLYCDPHERFSVVSFVWGPGQRTPIHDHTVWGLIGMLRGAEVCEGFELAGEGSPPRATGTVRLEAGGIEAVSPRIGDIHRVSNAFDDRASISIHVYGANIGGVRRHVFDPLTGAAKEFISGYASPNMPNFWDRSRA